jgi:shikimate kinase
MEPVESVERVLLVGFMAAGKTTVGRRLAGLLGWTFIDFDDIIEARTGLTVPAIFRERGEAVFRGLEARLTDEYGGAAHVVLAPGGGWITQPELLDRLPPGTLVVWLRISPGEAVRRALADDVHRPLLAGADPLAKARLLLSEREPLYFLADATVDVDGRAPEDIAREIAAKIRLLSQPNTAGFRPDETE